MIYNLHWLLLTLNYSYDLAEKMIPFLLLFTFKYNAVAWSNWGLKKFSRINRKVFFKKSRIISSKLLKKIFGQNGFFLFTHDFNHLYWTDPPIFLVRNFFIVFRLINAFHYVNYNYFNYFKKCFSYFFFIPERFYDLI